MIKKVNTMCWKYYNFCILWCHSISSFYCVYIEFCQFLCYSHFWFLTFFLGILKKKFVRFLCFFVAMYFVVQTRKILTLEFSNTSLGDAPFLSIANIYQIIPIQATEMPFWKFQITLILFWMKAWIIKKLLNYWILDLFLTF